MDITVEVYKADKRKKSGERLVEKIDLTNITPVHAEIVTKKKYPASKGYRFELHSTYVTRTNMMSKLEYTERYDTPRYCSPSSEAYWSM